LNVPTGIDVEDEEVGAKVDAGLPPGKALDVLLISAGYFTTETFDELNFKVRHPTMNRWRLREMLIACAWWAWGSGAWTAPSVGAWAMRGPIMHAQWLR
jgi:hypothetical protein